MPQAVRDMVKSGQQELQDIEERRNDLLLEHQKMQERSQKLQSLQDRKEAVLGGFGQMGWRQRADQE